MKRSHKDFVNAVRAKGGYKMFPTGGLVTPMTQQPTLLPAQVNLPNDLNFAAFNSSGQPMNKEGQVITGAINPNTGQLPGLTQGGLAGALTAQNQFQAQLAPQQQMNYQGLINAASANALSTPDQVAANIVRERGLEGQLQATAMGQGPNPAQAALAQATGANIANQSAMMAGQRGASANVGLMARQAAQQGATTQQQSIGQAALLQAQQQIAAQQQMAGVQGQVGQQLSAQQGAANQLLGIGAGALNTQNANAIANTMGAQGLNAQIAAANAAGANNTLGGILNAAGTVGAAGASWMGNTGGSADTSGQAPGTAMSHAEPMTNYAEGGAVEGQLEVPTYNPPQDPNAPSSYAGKYLNDPMQFDVGKSAATPAAPDLSKYRKADTSQDSIGQAMGIIGSIAGIAAMFDQGGKVVKGAEGKPVPGQAEVSGNSLKNDKVPAMLSPGEIVLPRTVTQSPDAAKKAAQFVMAIKSKQGLKRKKK